MSITIFGALFALIFIVVAWLSRLAITQFGVTEALTRSREGLNLAAADVYIGKGTDDWSSLEDIDTDAMDTMVTTNMETLGINSKGSPTWKSDDIVEEVDYENRKQGVSGEGTVTLMDINQDLIDWVDGDLVDELVTIIIVPRDYIVGDKYLVIMGVKLTGAVEGKANDDTSSTLKLTYKKRAKKRSDFERIGELQAVS